MGRDLASLADQGPLKSEPAKRRVRALLGGLWLVDTLDAVYVWEHSYYPLFYVPLAALQDRPARPAPHDGDRRRDPGYWEGALQSRGCSAQAVVFERGPLAGLVRITGAASDLEWFAEDEKVLGHPRDPYKRIECLPSSRAVRVEVDGTVVAQCTSSVFLYETGLRARYYLLPTAVRDWSRLQVSETVTFCPYKGEARYYDLVLDDRTIRDAVWYYKAPLPESSAIQGRLCFYNEKLDVFVDGVQE